MMATTGNRWDFDSQYTYCVCVSLQFMIDTREYLNSYDRLRITFNSKRKYIE